MGMALGKEWEDGVGALLSQGLQACLPRAYSRICKKLLYTQVVYTLKFYQLGVLSMFPKTSFLQFFYFPHFPCQDNAEPVWLACVQLFLACPELMDSKDFLMLHSPCINQVTFPASSWACQCLSSNPLSWACPEIVSDRGTGLWAFKFPSVFTLPLPPRM